MCLWLTDTLKYKIEIRLRNHNTVSRDDAIKTIAECIPGDHKVDLSNPELFILVELFKVSIVLKVALISAIDGCG